MPSLADADEPDELPADPELRSGVCGPLCTHLLREVAEVVTHTIGAHHLAMPRVCLLLVGNHPAAVSYAQSTVAAARAAGVLLHVERLPENAEHVQVANLIAMLNADCGCHGARLRPTLRVRARGKIAAGGSAALSPAYRLPAPRRRKLAASRGPSPVFLLF